MLFFKTVYILTYIEKQPEERIPGFNSDYLGGRINFEMFQYYL